jgi:hypothetical protein
MTTNFAYSSPNTYAVKALTSLKQTQAPTACAFIRERKVSLVVLDWDLHKTNCSPDHPSTGLKVLQTCREVDPLLPVISDEWCTRFEQSGMTHLWRGRIAS